MSCLQPKIQDRTYCFYFLVFTWLDCYYEFRAALNIFKESKYILHYIFIFSCAYNLACLTLIHIYPLALVLFKVTAMIFGFNNWDNRQIFLDSNIDFQHFRIYLINGNLVL